MASLRHEMTIHCRLRCVESHFLREDWTVRVVPILLILHNCTVAHDLLLPTTVTNTDLHAVRYATPRPTLTNLNQSLISLFPSRPLPLSAYTHTWLLLCLCLCLSRSGTVRCQHFCCVFQCGPLTESKNIYIHATARRVSSRMRSKRSPPPKGQQRPTPCS